MKTKVFHQFISLVRGYKNTIILDFLKGSVFCIENKFIKKFEKGEFKGIEDFVKSLQEEEMIIEVEKGEWVPSIEFKSNEILNDLKPILEIEEGVNIKLLQKKFYDFEFQRITFFGKNRPAEILPFTLTLQKEKNFRQCLQCSKVGADLDEIDEESFIFNKYYNSCWGKKLAVTKDMKVRPCIYSEIAFGDLEQEDIDDILKGAEEYWCITKDKVEKCKDCERRYNCFDCREIARRAKGDLYAANPYCDYDPYNGNWPS